MFNRDIFVERKVLRQTFTLLFVLLLSLSGFVAGASRDAVFERNDKPMPVGLQHEICTTIKADATIEDINDSLARGNRESFEYEFHNIKCNVGLVDRPVNPFKTLIHRAGPLSRIAKGIMAYYHKKIKRPDLLINALNTPDKSGRTILDYHAFILAKLSDSLKPEMERLRKRLCRYGGRYSDPALNKNCKTRYK